MTVSSQRSFKTLYKRPRLVSNTHWAWEHCGTCMFMCNVSNRSSWKRWPKQTDQRLNPERGTCVEWQKQREITRRKLIWHAARHRGLTRALQQTAAFHMRHRPLSSPGLYSDWLRGTEHWKREATRYQNSGGDQEGRAGCSSEPPDNRMSEKKRVNKAHGC